MQIGQEFNVVHAAGITRYRIERRYRQWGYFECVGIQAVSGTHHFLGSLQIFSQAAIEEAIAATERDRAKTTPRGPWHVGYWINRYAGWFRVQHFAHPQDVVRFLQEHGAGIDSIDFIVEREPEARSC